MEEADGGMLIQGWAEVKPAAGESSHCMGVRPLSRDIAATPAGTWSPLKLAK